MKSDFEHLTSPVTAPTVDQGVKERIVDSAIKLFCKKGYDGASVREIVEAAGVTKPVLYYYFKNKEDLFHCIITNAMNDFDDRHQEAIDSTEDDFCGCLFKIAKLYIDIARESTEFVKFFHSIAFSGQCDHIFDFPGAWARRCDQLVRRFEEAQKQGILRADISARVMMRCFLGMAEAAMQSIVYCPDESEPSIEAAPIVAMAIHGMAVSQATI